MIFTQCIECEKPIMYPYEAGDKPFGKDVYGLVVCECETKNYIERLSFSGVTISEKELLKRQRRAKRGNINKALYCAIVLIIVFGFLTWLSIFRFKECRANHFTLVYCVTGN